MNRRYMAASLAVVMAATVVSPITADAASSYNMRKKVITTAGILSGKDDNRTISRAQFARMLVEASTYKTAISSQSNVSVFSDVDRNNEYASYIKTAVEQGWMTGYLGGKFKPEEPITMQEALRGILALLGYKDEDFGNNQAANRMAKASYLELNDEISKTGPEVLNQFDCVNLFYNLLKTNTKAFEGQKASTGTVYASVLGFSLTSDGEINPLEKVESKLKGPYAVKNRPLSLIVPFSLSNASFYLDGDPSERDTLESSAIVVYYNSVTKSVYGYSEEGTGGRGAVTGKLTAIYYKSSDVAIPSAIQLDGTDIYQITSSDMQYAFSLYGDIKVHDTITVIWEQRGNGDDTEDPTVIDYIE